MTDTRTAEQRARGCGEHIDCAWCCPGCPAAMPHGIHTPREEQTTMTLTAPETAPPADDFDRRTWCACHTIELRDGETAPDATDDTLVHTTVVCCRGGSVLVREPDLVDELEATVRKLRGLLVRVDRELYAQSQVRKFVLNALHLAGDLVDDAVGELHGLEPLRSVRHLESCDRIKCPGHELAGVVVGWCRVRQLVRDLVGEGAL